ncbi:hypothetical protein BDN72DRAFT_596348 [Pluteus cervinus]|uniref:Uncharacterized protein n=1 Tax=Pluteus cervinus TaxID=181527 RepID=A0ACD3AVC4_9AGAR|nr:hypothetical protein BDN72DRAFT_596348 [Pluteus cervinus]
MSSPSFPHPFVINQASFTVIAKRTIDILSDPQMSENVSWSICRWIAYCSSSPPTPQLVLRLACFGLRPRLCSGLFATAGWERSTHGYTWDMLKNYLDLRTWVHSWPFLSRWLDTLIPIEFVENLMYEVLCRYPDEEAIDLLQQLVASKKHPQAQRCRLLLNQRIQKLPVHAFMHAVSDHKEYDLELQRLFSSQIHACLDSLKHAARPTAGVRRYVRFLWHFSCFVFIGLPYYTIYSVLQTSEYTHMCRTPYTGPRPRSDYTQIERAPNNYPGLLERLRRWAQMNWRVEYTIGGVVLVFLLVLMLAWIIY